MREHQRVYGVRARLLGGGLLSLRVGGFSTRNLCELIYSSQLFVLEKTSLILVWYGGVCGWTVGVLTGVKCEMMMMMITPSF